MAFKGMDDTVVDGVVQQMRRMAGQLQTIAASVDGEVTRVSGVWIGEASSQMVADWRGQHAPGLRAAADSVTTFAGRLSQNVSEQRVASDTYVGDSSLRGHLGSGPGGGGGGGGWGGFQSAVAGLPDQVVRSLLDQFHDPTHLADVAAAGIALVAKEYSRFAVRIHGRFASFTGSELEKLIAQTDIGNFVANSGKAELFSALKLGSKLFEHGGSVIGAAAAGLTSYLDHASLPEDQRVGTAVLDAGASAAGSVVGSAAFGAVGGLIGGPFGCAAGVVIGGAVGSVAGEAAAGLVESIPGMTESLGNAVDVMASSAQGALGEASKFLHVGFPW